MTTETILADEETFRLITGHEISTIDASTTLFSFTRDEVLEAARAILQSPEIQALRKDAERFKKMASYIYEIKRTHRRDDDNKVRRLEIDIRNHTPSPTKWLENAVDELDAAMEQQI